MTAAKRIEPARAIVQAALEAPVVRRISAERRAALEEDLRSLVESDAPEGMLREVIALRLEDEERIEQEEPLTPEEMEEIERRADEAEEDLAAGNYVTAEQYFAERGIPWPPAG